MLKTSKLSSKQPALKLNLSNLSELTLIKHRRATCGVFVYADKKTTCYASGMYGLKCQVLKKEHRSVK